MFLIKSAYTINFNENAQIHKKMLSLEFSNLTLNHIL